MAYDQALAERVRNTISSETGWVAKEMFGGIWLYAAWQHGVRHDRR